MYERNQMQNGYFSTLQEINFLIDLLYVTPCIYTRNILLNQLRYKISNLSMLADKYDQSQLAIGINQTQSLPQAQHNFTMEELIKYNGKNGNPAYVAVNGIVYDVTNNAAWAAATHFGLTAGKDLSGEFSSCHAGQQILNKLRVVGRLV